MSAIVSDSNMVQLSTSDICEHRHGISAEQALQAQASAATPTGFNYAALAAGDAEDLRQHADRLRGLISKSTAHLIEIGTDLIAIKARLKHGQFVSWVEREIGIGIRTAQSWMAVAKLADGKSETVSRLPPSTVRMLASKSAPPQIVEDIVARAASGDVLPDDTVAAMIRFERVEKKRQAFQDAEAAKRRSKRGKAAEVRMAEAVEKSRAELEKRKADDRAAAKAIIDRFSPDDVQFLSTIQWEVFQEFKRLVAGRAE